MKKKLIILLLSLFLSMGIYRATAQTNPPAPPGNGSSGNQASGGSAPIGGGLFILLGLGVAYGSKKIYNNRKSLLEE